MNCTNCGKPLEADAVFCPECGAAVEAPVMGNDFESSYSGASSGAAQIFCPMCGAPTDADSAWCVSCGAALNTTKTGRKKGNGFDVKKLIVPAVAVVAVVCVVLLVGRLFGNKKMPILYTKDGNLYANAWKEDTEVRVEKDYDSSSPIPQFSEDKKYLYYAGDYSGSNYNLYRKKVKDLDGDDERIAKDICAYTLLDNNKVIFRDSDDNLYVTDGDEKEKFDSDIRSYFVNDEETKVVWLTDEGDMYVQDVKMKDDRERIAEEVSSVDVRTSGFEQIAYYKNDGLYILSDLENENKVFDAEDHVRDNSIYIKDNEIVVYYTTVAEEEERTAYDFIQDDMFEADAAITEPDRSDYEHVELRKNGWGTYEDTVLDESYYTDYDKYEEKCNRDDDRKWMQDYEIELDRYDFCYYTVENGRETLNTCYSAEFSTNYNGRVITKQQMELNNVSARMSDFYGENATMNIYDFCDDIENKLYENGRQVYFYDGKERAQLDDSEGDSFNIIGDNEDKELFYALQYESDSSSGSYDLVSISYGKEFGEIKTIEQDVDTAMYAGEQLFYMIDDDLYCEEERIEKEIEWFSVRSIDDSDSVMVLSSDSSGADGDLKIWNGKKLKEIEKDVRQYLAVDEKNVAIIHDYSDSSGSGTLSYFNGKDTERLEQDVRSILWCY